VTIVTVFGLNSKQNPPNADAKKLHDIVDGERPLSPAVSLASADPPPSLVGENTPEETVWSLGHTQRLSPVRL